MRLALLLICLSRRREPWRGAVILGRRLAGWPLKLRRKEATDLTHGKVA